MDKGVHTFPKYICLKVIVIARLKFELAYYSAVQHFNHYTTELFEMDLFWYLTVYKQNLYLD